ncbi:MAG: MerR family transcriptional regulator [Rubrivivax sp.]
MENSLPLIPAKRYFTIGEVSELCQVKSHVLRYWEQEFTQLKPMKRRGNRRYYQHHEVLLIRRIRELLYEQGFTINGARQRLSDAMAGRPPAPGATNIDFIPVAIVTDGVDGPADGTVEEPPADPSANDAAVVGGAQVPVNLRAELRSIRALLDA